MAALACCRRPIAADEFLPVLLAIDAEPDPNEPHGSFADDAQAERFMALWTQRWDEVVASLDAEVQALDDERAYGPEVLDMRGLLASLPPEEREADVDDSEIPSFAQVWALGFMYAVESWAEEWTPPRDRDAAKVLDEAMTRIVALTEDDTDPPEIAMYEEDGEPTVSRNRLEAFGEAIWAVYDMRAVWRQFGPRVEQVRRLPTPGRNDPCSCGSGKKYKKCCGA